MLIRLPVIFLLFGLLGIFQTGFFTHFNIMGASLNLIFILFYIIVFFENSKKYIQGIFSAFTAGFFLDIFSSFYFGTSFICLLIIAFILKHMLELLRKKKGEYPITYFISLFVLSFIIYNLFLAISVYLLNSHMKVSLLNWIFVIEIAYNLLFAVFGFYIYKKFKLYKIEE
ncbi:MAG: hypothetical protein HY005_02545 [Candidatus Staskawiczbacteria bacterium]|nr:hypothetical protein [Candidatus Staskawiczbacteria bacterium]MBI3337478.1 hypothetical protein [Candidatus Staskawiczbacteria bacterium]